MTNRLFDTGIYDSGIFKTAQPYTFDSGIFDSGIFDVKPSQTGNLARLNKAQDANTVIVLAKVNIAATFSATEEDAVVSSTINKPFNATVGVTQEDDSLRTFDPYFVAPSYGHWVKKQNRSKPLAPQLPKPVEAGEIVIDEAVLRQMEEELLAALVLQAKRDALERVEDLRTYTPGDRGPTRSIKINPQRFDVVETSPEIRSRVITLFRPPPPPPLKAAAPNLVTLHALGPRRLPEPDIRKTRTISLRRSDSRPLKTGT